MRYILLIIAGIVVSSFALLGQDVTKCNDGSRDLSTRQQELLLKYGAISASTHFIVSAQLVPDCESRMAVSSFISDVVLRGGASEQDLQFATNHGDLISSVVLKIWNSIANSPAIPPDGTLRHDRWALLTEQAVSDSVVSDIAIANIQHEGFSADITYLLLDRPLMEVIPAARAVLSKKSISPTEAIFAIAFLSKVAMGEATESLSDLISHTNLTKQQRRVAGILRGKFVNGTPATWADVEALASEQY